jgi:hypothetical protein
MSKDPTPADVAAWMVSELETKKSLYQDDAADKIKGQFGKAFIYDNEDGGTSITKPVLAAFAKLTGTAVVWCRSDRYWRARVKSDDPGRMQP